jgi:hypothetical protein
MTRHTLEPTMKSWLVRISRGRRLDRNPLRRPSDRAETVIGVLLLVAFAVATPFAARAAAAGTRTLAEHSRVTALATRHEVTTVTLETAPPAVVTPYALLIQTWVSAEWTAPDGRQRTGQIRVLDSTQKGSPERIWVTGSGGAATPPLPMTEIARLAGDAAFGAIMVLIFVFLIAGSVTRRVINRRRMAAWDAEWAATEPRWNHQN